jgi:sulfonate transport system permease protein
VLRPLPASAMMPVFIGLLGFTPQMILAVIAFGALWPVLLSTMHGFSSIEPRLLEVGRLLGLSRRAFIFKIGLPSALPDALAGMRLALTVSLILAVVGEMLTAQPGLGRAILFAARSFKSADLFAGVMLLGLIGFSCNALLAGVERRALAWRQTR